MYRLTVIGLCAHSAFNPVAADECPGEPDLSAPAGTKFFGAGNGWCSSDLDKKVGPACTPAECWDLCVEAYGADSIFAVELNGVGGSCYCQSACDCMESGGSDQYVIARDTLEELPDTCDDDWSNDDWSNNDDIECAGETNFTAPANTTFFGDSVGWCSSDLNGNVGRACTPAECWDLCVDAYGADAIFAADLSTSGSCYCQNSCDCMDGSGSYQVIARDTLEELPDACDDDWAPECPGEANFTAPAGTTFFEATGWCDSSLNAYVGQACTPAECWDLCVDAYGADAIFAADLEYAGGSCYCQNSCDCMDGSGPNQVIARDTLEELPDACVTECSCPYQYDGMCDVDLDYCSCDPHDCSSLGSIFVCEACVDAGGVFCAKDALCAAPGEAPSLETLQTFAKTATCDAADYSTDCPTHPLPDPAYDAVAWYLGAINVEEVWAAGITGAGVTVLINDEGVDASHPDLKKLSVEDSCDNYLNGAATDTHGTVCAALAVGSSNKHCGVGVAHGASLASCKTMGEGDTDEDVAAFAKGDVNSNSWGIDSCFVPTSYSFDYDRRLDDACPFSSDVYDTPCSYYACYDADFSRGGTLGEACKEVVVGYCSNSLKFEHDRDACLDLDRYYVDCWHNQIAKDEQDAIKAGVTDGRGGKGIVYVFSSGNEYTASGNTNFEGYLNSRYCMTVGAVGMDLLHASYSSTGASMFVSAPGGDRGDVRGMVTANPVATGTSCGDGGVGTSYATPIVSGVAALMLEANPNLGWRDVQGIIATTSKLPDDDGDLPRSVNAAGIGHSYQYGFGIIDAAAAVAAARTWQNYYTETVLTAMASPGLRIADDGAAVTSKISAAADADFEIETVVVVLTIDHPRRGDLRIVLERGGVESLLAPDSREDGDGYADWKYMTVRHWGESANGGGAWKLKVEDVRAGNGPGTFVSWTLQVHGHPTGCQTYTERFQCKTNACDWKKKQGKCKEQPRCADQKKKKACRKQAGCQWKKGKCAENACADDASWAHLNKKNKRITCVNVARNPGRRCGLDGAADACAKTCGAC